MERIGRFDREMNRVVRAYRSIEDQPTPGAYLAHLTNALDNLCVLVEEDPPAIEDVFPREWLALVGGGSIGVVVSEGAGGCGEVAPSLSELSEVSA